MAISTSTTIILLLLVSASVQAAPMPIETPGWLAPMIPTKGTTFQDEIKCYSLPYGGIGFLSHLLTYWAVFWLGFGRRPWMPWQRLSAGNFDLCLSLVQIVFTISIASFTIARCRDRWQFMLIAIWKLVMSVQVGFWGLRASVLVKRGYESLKGTFIWSTEDWTAYTLIFYISGMTVGMVGLLSLVWQLRHDQQILQISAAFFSVTFFIMLVCMILSLRCCGMCSSLKWHKLFMAVAFTVMIVCALYSDWILGIIAGNLVGMPSRELAPLYWTYFAAKRLPLFFS